MALKKALMTQYGIHAEYWRVLRSEEIYPNRNIVYVAGYLNKEVRDSGYQPLHVLNYDIPQADMLRADIYNWLKQPLLKPDIKGKLTESNLLLDAKDC